MALKPTASTPNKMLLGGVRHGDGANICAAAYAYESETSEGVPPY